MSDVVWGRKAGILSIAMLFLAFAFAFNHTGQAKAAGTVTITGNAYAFIFGGNMARLEGAVIKVQEFPELEATAGPNGAYSLEVPDDANITLTASFAGYYPVTDQTFHTRGKDLNQVNFQMPEQGIAELMAGIVGAGVDGEAGSKVLQKCAVVSTFFQKEGRSFLDFDDFHDFRPHGVIGATAILKDANGDEVVPPLYFNSSVIPDPAQLSSSRDGGVIWHSVPEGNYTVTASHPTARFSQFEVTCKNGRLVNANPPWGLYELARTEEPNPAVLPYVAPTPDPDPVVPPDTVLDANLASAKVTRKGAKKRTLTVKVRSGEDVTAAFTARQGKKKLKSNRSLETGITKITIPVGAAFKAGALDLSVKLTDEAGNSRTDQASLNVPAAKKPRKRK